MAFSDGQLVTAADLNAFSVTTVTTTGAITPGGAINASGASAGQIVFPATQNASANANTLDDYQEEAFTPSVSFGGSSAGVTASVAVGYAIKIGQLVWFSIRLTLTSNGSGTGNARITGLPFTSSSTANVFGGVQIPFYVNLSGATAITGYVENNTTTILLQVPGATATALASETTIPDNAELLVIGTYRAAA